MASQMQLENQGTFSNLHLIYCKKIHFISFCTTDWSYIQILDEEEEDMDTTDGHEFLMEQGFNNYVIYRKLLT